MKRLVSEVRRADKQSKGIVKQGFEKAGQRIATDMQYKARQSKGIVSPRVEPDSNGMAP